MNERLVEAEASDDDDDDPSSGRCNPRSCKSKSAPACVELGYCTGIDRGSDGATLLVRSLVATEGPGYNPHFGHSQRNDDERGSSIDNARGSGRDDTRSKAKETLLLRARYLY
jgi:hypothetical protein